MDIVKDAYDRLCEARDALDAGPPDGPEHDVLFDAYLKTRGKQLARVSMVPIVIDPVPAMNRRFFRMAHEGHHDIEIDLPTREYDRIYGAGNGNGWDRARAFPRLRARTTSMLSARHLPPVMGSIPFRGSSAVSRSLLDIWQRFDPDALDVLPITLTRRRGQPVAEEYCLVDVVRKLPAFDIGAMNSYLFRSPKPYEDRYEIFPPPRAFALRDDLTTDGVHLFRDAIESEWYFVSAELRQACLDAGFKGIPLVAPETPRYPTMGILTQRSGQ